MKTKKQREQKNKTLELSGEFYSVFLDDLEKSFQINIKLGKGHRNLSTLEPILAKILHHFSFSPHSSNIEEKGLALLKEKFEMLFGKTLELDLSTKEAFGPDPVKNWKKLEKEMQVRFPPLQLSKVLEFFSFCGFILSFGGFYYLFCTSLPKLESLTGIWFPWLLEHTQTNLVIYMLAFVIGIILAPCIALYLFWHWFDKKIANELPPVYTMQALLGEIYRMNYAKLTNGHYSKEEVERFIIQQIARHAGLKEIEITAQMAITFTSE